MGRDTIQLEDAVSTISEEYLLEFTSEYGIPENLHPELPGPEESIVDFPEGKVGVYTKFFEFANYRIPLSQFLFDILRYYQIYLSQLSVIGAAKQATGKEHPTMLHQAPRLLEELEQSVLLGGRKHIPHRYGMAYWCPKGWDATSRFLFRIGRNDVKHTSNPFPKTTRALIMPSRAESELLSGGRQMDLFNLINAPNPTKLKTGTLPRAAHEVPLLTTTANRVIDMEDITGTSESSRTPSTVEKSLLDFADEDPPPAITERVETKDQEAAIMGSLVRKRRYKRGNDDAEENAPPKVLRKDHASIRPEQSTQGGKSLASMGLAAGSTFVTPTDAKNVSDTGLLSYAEPQPHPEQDIAQ
ncbi:hypothetical protein Tco_0169372 [Tanacetum coccineum]